MRVEDVRYAASGDLRIAYQEFGDGDLELVVVLGFVSNLDLAWDAPPIAPILRRLGDFARCVVFDKRGTGLSDRELGFGSLEERSDDIRAVVDAVGFEQPAVFAFSEGGPLSLVYAASHPDRVGPLALYGTMARCLRAPDYPDGTPPELRTALADSVEEHWGTGRAFDPFVQRIPDDAASRELVARYSRLCCSPRMARHILLLATDLDIRSILPSVSTPTLVLHSEHDPLVPVTWGRWIADHVPGARWVARDIDYHMVYDGSEAWYLDEVQEFLTGDRPVPGASVERVLATVLFTDIVGSTERAALVGDQAWRRVLDQHDAVTAEEVRAYGGSIVKTTGDGVLATFDGPSRAVACARAMRDRLAEIDLVVRAGVHTGEIERRGADVGGISVHIGARIADLAGPGEVWVSRTVKELTVGSGLEFDDRGSRELKGVPGDWELYELHG